jgi:hypothetical protein
MAGETYSQAGIGRLGGHDGCGGKDGERDARREW